MLGFSSLSSLPLASVPPVDLEVIVIGRAALESESLNRAVPLGGKNILVLSGSANAVDIEECPTSAVLVDSRNDYR